MTEDWREEYKSLWDLDGKSYERIEAFISTLLTIRTEQAVAEEREENSDVLEEAWGIIANVSGSDWLKQNEEWQSAAKRWRDKYFAYLSRYVATLQDPRRGGSV